MGETTKTTLYVAFHVNVDCYALQLLGNTNVRSLQVVLWLTMVPVKTASSVELAKSRRVEKL
jgi:hypothetical protein